MYHQLTEMYKLCTHIHLACTVSKIIVILGTANKQLKYNYYLHQFVVFAAFNYSYLAPALELYLYFYVINSFTSYIIQLYM